MKRMWAPAMVLLSCAGLFVGCQSLTSPESASDATALESSFDITSAAAQVSLLQSAGVNVDSANGFFMVHWHEFPNPGQTTVQLAGHANAVSYGATQSFPRSRVPGVDMGTVALSVAQSSYTLPKLESASAGIRYGGMEKGGGRGPGGHGPGDGGPGNGGPGNGGPGHGGRGPHGGGPGQGGAPPALVDSLNIPFVSGGTYAFAASGSSAVPALNLDIQAPVALAQIGGVADDDTIAATQDLTITWTPDASVTSMTLVLAPAIERGRNHGGAPSTNPPDLITLDPAAGSYTISAQALQDALGSAKGLMLHLDQGTFRTINNSDGTKYIVSLRSSDGVRLHVN